MTDKKIPILPPPMPQMLEPTNDAAIWEEIRQRQDINSKDDTF